MKVRAAAAAPPLGRARAVVAVAPRPRASPLHSHRRATLLAARADDDSGKGVLAATTRPATTNLEDSIEEELVRRNPLLGLLDKVGELSARLGAESGGGGGLGVSAANNASWSNTSSTTNNNSPIALARRGIVTAASAAVGIVIPLELALFDPTRLPPFCWLGGAGGGDGLASAPDPVGTALLAAEAVCVGIFLLDLAVSAGRRRSAAVSDEDALWGEAFEEEAALAAAAAGRGTAAAAMAAAAEAQQQQPQQRNPPLTFADAAEADAAGAALMAADASVARLRAALRARRLTADAVTAIPWDACAIALASTLGGAGAILTAASGPTAAAATAALSLTTLPTLFYSGAASAALLAAPLAAPLKLLHLGRLGRVRSFFSYLEYGTTSPLLAVTVARNFTAVGFAVHWLACAFAWRARSGGFSPGVLVGVANPQLFASSGPAGEYLYSLWWALTTMAGNEWSDMQNVADLEQVGTATLRVGAFLLLSIALGAYVLGTLTLLVVKQDERTGRYRELSAGLRAFAAAHALPPELQSAMEDHLRLTFLADASASSSSSSGGSGGGGGGGGGGAVLAAAAAATLPSSSGLDGILSCGAGGGGEGGGGARGLLMGGGGGLSLLGGGGGGGLDFLGGGAAAALGKARAAGGGSPSGGSSPAESLDGGGAAAGSSSGSGSAAASTASPPSTTPASPTDGLADEAVLAIYPTAIRRRILRHLYGGLLRGCYLFASPAPAAGAATTTTAATATDATTTATPPNAIAAAAASAPQTSPSALPAPTQRFLDALLASARVELYRRGVEIVAAGDPVNELCLVVGGAVEVRLASMEAAMQEGAAAIAGMGVAGSGNGNGQAPPAPGTCVAAALADVAPPPALSSLDGDGSALGWLRSTMASVSSLDDGDLPALTLPTTQPSSSSSSPPPPRARQSGGAASAAAAAAALAAADGSVADSSAARRPRRVLAPGQLVGEVAFFTGACSLESVTAATPACRLLVVSRPAYDGVARTHPLAARLVLENLRRRAEAMVVSELNAAVAEGGQPQARLSPSPQAPLDLAAAAAAVGSTADPRRALVLGNLMRVNAVIADHAARQDEEAVTGFLYACSRGDARRVRALLAQGVGADAADYDGRTGVMLAAAKGHADVVALLLASGADPSRRDSLGRSALLEACFGGHDGVASALVAAGARVGGGSVGGGARGESGGAAGVLFPSSPLAGSPSSSPDGGGYSDEDDDGAYLAAAPLPPGVGEPREHETAALLCGCVFDCDLPLLRRLVTAGAPPWAADYDGRTALHIAAAEGNLAIARALVEAAATTALANSGGGGSSSSSTVKVKTSAPRGSTTNAAAANQAWRALALNAPGAAKASAALAAASRDARASAAVARLLKAEDRWGRVPVDEARRVGASAVVALLEAAAAVVGCEGVGVGAQSVPSPSPPPPAAR